MIRTLPSTVDFEAQLKAIDYPKMDAIDRWEVRLDEDWSGDPAVFVTITYKDAEIRDAWPTRNKLVDAVRSLAEAAFPDRWSYVDLTADSDIDPDPDPPRKTRKR